MLLLRVLAPVVAAFLTPALSLDCSKPFNVLDYGATGNGVSLDTASVQAAIVAAAGCPVGAQVLVPFRTSNSSTFLCNSLFLESNVDLHIEGGATILADPTISHWPQMWRPLFAGFGVPGLINGARCTANNASDCTQWRALKNVSISGSGTIDGNGFVWWSASTWWPTVPRPYLLELAWIDGLHIADVSLTHAGEREIPEKCHASLKPLPFAWPVSSLDTCPLVFCKHPH